MVKTLSSRRRHPLAGMAVIAFALMVFGVGYALVSPSAQAAGSGSVYSAQLVAQGKNLFENNCSTCHGVSGQGQQDNSGGVLGPSLVGVGAASVDFQVRTGRMPAANAGAQIEKHQVVFTQAESNAMAAYVASLGPGPAIPTQQQYSLDHPTNNEIGTGGELFRYNCSQCHGAAAGGGALANGAYAPRIAVSSKYIYEAMLSGPQQMPVFSDSTLAPKDKRLLIAYINNLRDQPNAGGIGFGRVGTVTEGLVAWVVGIGALMVVILWIGAKS